MLLVNPGGRYVEVDEGWEEWLKVPGFRLASESETISWRREQTARWENKQKGVLDDPDSLYFVSVTGKGRGDGYGMSSMHLMSALRELGVKVAEHYQNQHIGLVYHTPYAIMRLETRYRIIYTMFESSKIPQDWVQYLEMADKVLVPSKWCQKVFEKSGISAEVLPLGYNDKIFKYSPRPPRDTFTFLHYDAFNARKGHFEVLEAFEKAFGKDKSIRLVFKTHRDSVSVPLNKAEYPNVETIYGMSTEQELADICFNADAFVFPSRGEGFGLPPLEAMATGLPTIVPNAHGITEYFNPDYMYEVKVKEKTTPLYRRLTDVGYMVKVDVDDLAKQMKFVYEHRNQARLKGKEASEYVKNWTYRKAAERLMTLLDDIKKNPLPARKLTKKLPLELIK